MKWKEEFLGALYYRQFIRIWCSIGTAASNYETAKMFDRSV